MTFVLRVVFFFVVAVVAAVVSVAFVYEARVPTRV